MIINNTKKLTCQNRTLANILYYTNYFITFKSPWVVFISDFPRGSQWSCIFSWTTVTVSESFGQTFTERQEVCWCDRMRQGTRNNRLHLPPCQQEAGLHAGSKGETAAHCCSVASECELLRVLKKQVFYQSVWSASVGLSSRKVQGALVLLLNCLSNLEAHAWLQYSQGLLGPRI